MLPLILIIAVVLYAAAYSFYGRFLQRKYDVDDSRTTPSHSDFDGVDRVPAHKTVLLGHHFSSIAGAGPIVGPIIAAAAFGWGPTLLWIILGAIFIGGVHDYSALIASIRHKARSIAEIAKIYMSPLAYKMFLVFIWLTLVYVLTVFMDLTATTFVQSGGVATSALMFIVLAVVFGIYLNKARGTVAWGSVIFVPLVFVAVWGGQQIPIAAETIGAFFGGQPGKVWAIILVGYAFIASTTPVWLLLQPRDYLSSYLLYATVLGGFLGILLGEFSLEFPMFNAWYAPAMGSLFPILFITVACGACSGFHSIVASGTSSKQLDKESDARMIGYGSMLLEGVVAVIAMATVAILPKGDPKIFNAPLAIFGAGMGKFLSVFGIPADLGASFGLLALSTFILTTLDTATRLGRYVFEEFFNLKGPISRYFATLSTLVLPTIFVLITIRDPQGNPIPAWKAIWPVFGATNQLLAGLALLVIAVWLLKTGKRIFFVVAPMIFMNIMTIWALVLLVVQYKFATVGWISIILLMLAILLLLEACRTLKSVRKAGS